MSYTYNSLWGNGNVGHSQGHGPSKTTKYKSEPCLHKHLYVQNLNGVLWNAIFHSLQLADLGFLNIYITTTALVEA